MNACISAYLEFCRPFTFPAPWNCFQADQRALLGPSDPKAVLAVLAQRHPSGQLIESGIARLDANGELALHSLLAVADVGLLQLVDANTRQFRNLMTEKGCVFGDNPPLLEILLDWHTHDALAAAGDRHLHLTETFLDTILLRSMGMAAAPIVGFGQLNQQGIELLCEYYGFRQGRSEREKEEDFDAEQDEHGLKSAHQTQDPVKQDGARPGAKNAAAPPQFAPQIVPGFGNLGQGLDDCVRLVFVRWTPHRISKTDPISIQSAIDELKSLKLYRRLSINEAGQWIPADSDLETIRFAVSRGEPNWIKAAFLDSAYKGISPVENWKATAGTLPTDLCGAIEYLHEAMLGSSDEKNRQRRKEALHNYHRVVARQVTEPLLHQAEATADPLDRALQLQFGQLNALFLEMAPTVREQLLQGLAPQREESLKGRDKSVSKLLAISSQMVSLAKEMKKWKPRPTSAPSKTSTNLNFTRRFADSDLVLQN